PLHSSHHNPAPHSFPTRRSSDLDVMTRFVGYGWNVTRVSDANDLNWLARGYETFLKTKDRPTLIVVDSHIGYGSPHKQDSSDARSEEHTSELQSRFDLVCRLLLE